MLFYVETYGLWPQLLPTLSLLVRSVKRSLRITNLIKEKTDFTLGCPNEELGLKICCAFKFLVFFHNLWGMGGYWKFGSTGVVQIRNVTFFKEMGRCRSVDDQKIFLYIS